MEKLNVRHFLSIYQLREKMQEAGVTNPSLGIRTFTRALVEKLLKMPLDEEVKIINRSFYDSKGNLIAEIPSKATS